MTCANTVFISSQSRLFDLRLWVHQTLQGDSFQYFLDLTQLRALDRPRDHLPSDVSRLCAMLAILTRYRLL